MRPLLALLILLVAPAQAMDAPGAEGHIPSWPEQQALRCLDAIRTAEQAANTLPGLLAAIARAESGRPVPNMPGLQPWPWAVNADGAAYYFDSKPAAVAWVRQAQDRGVRQIDVGCMQVNLQAHPNAFPTLEQAFEPATNAAYAARFLSRLREESGNNWYIATGYYHSRTPDRAADYRLRVAAIAEGRIPPASLGVPLYMRAIQQGTLRIALPGGGTFRINVGRQPAARARPRPDACRIAAVLGDYMSPRARTACTIKRPTPARQAG